MGDVLGERLDDALDGHPAVVELRGRGMFRGIELRPSGGALSARPSCAECLARDVWVYPAGSGPPVTDAVMIGPPADDHRGRDRPGVDTLAAALDVAVATA